MKKRVVLKKLKITANLKTGRFESLTANRILTRRKITAKKNQWSGGIILCVWRRHFIGAEMLFCGTRDVILWA